MRISRVLRAVVLAAAIPVMASSAAVRAAGAPAIRSVDLAAHRAVYEITLNQSREGVGPTTARGLMAYSFSDACESWIVNNRIVMDVLFGEETPVRTDWTFNSWESKDGREYGYKLVHKRNGHLAEELTGKANLDAEGGKAEFTGEAPETMPLPKGTLFPTAHLLASLNAAHAGKKTFAQPLFDGGSMDNPYVTNVYFVAARNRDAQAKKLLADNGFAADVPVVRYQAAFFSRESGEGTPVFELQVDYREDGIAERIIQFFSDFSILMTPVKIESLKGGC